MFDYNICNEADANLFHKQCAAIETHITPLEKDKLLTDVDGTLRQKYHHPFGVIDVVNDIQVGALYVTSEFDLTPFFER